jgi:hypothetical protein
MMRKIALPIFGLMTTLALSLPVSADTLNLSLAMPSQAAEPGSTLIFIATVSAPGANAADVFLNEDSTSVQYPLTLDDSPFFSNFPLFLAPGDSFTGELFDIDIPSYASFGDYPNGYFEIDGGADDNASNFLASVNFDVDVTPEPGGAILLLIGLSGLWAVFRCRQRLN